jgi:hypothetical protein
MVAASLQSGALVRVLPGHSQRADVWGGDVGPFDLIGEDQGVCGFLSSGST